MYWNCQQVREKLSEWLLFVAEENGVAGEIMDTSFMGGMYEIFSLGCEDGRYCEGCTSGC